MGFDNPINPIVAPPGTVEIFTFIIDWGDINDSDLDTGDATVDLIGHRDPADELVLVRFETKEYTDSMGLRGWVGFHFGEPDEPVNIEAHGDIVSSEETWIRSGSRIRVSGLLIPWDAFHSNAWLLSA